MRYSTGIIKVALIICMSVAFMGCLEATAYGWGIVTHEALSEYAADRAIVKPCIDAASEKCGYLEDKLGFINGVTTEIRYSGISRTIKDWLGEGAKSEDEPPRWVNHFHDPMWSMGEWDKAGLESPLGRSSPLWAQNSSWQHAWPTVSSPRDWSWPTVREYFYTALTSTDEATRQEYFAMTFRGVGQQMHLLEDMAVPEHVRTGGKS